MTESDPEGPTFDPKVIAAVETALAGVLSAAPAASPGVGEIVGYLARSLPPERRAAVEDAMAGDDACREAVFATAAVLARVRAAAPGTFQATDPAEADVAREWEALLAQRAAAPLPVASGWDALRRALAEGRAGAAAAWAEFAAVGEQLLLHLQAPRIALTRGTEPAPDSPAILRAEITSAGALEAEATVPADYAGTVRLDLWFAGRSWPLAECEAVDGRARWQVPDLGALFGLPEGGIPAGWLRVSAPPAASPEPAETSMLAPLVRANGSAAGGPPAVVVFRGEPTWERRSYTLRLAVPPDLLGRYPRHRVRVEVPVGEGIRQVLGAWPLAAEMEIRAPWPGAPDQPHPGAPWPRLSLIGPEL
jgi:hypothetical protein